MAVRVEELGTYWVQQTRLLKQKFGKGMVLVGPREVSSCFNMGYLNEKER